MQLWRLFKLGLAYPFFIGPTLKATRKSIEVATANYGKQHHKNTAANAFRHALWNYFIAKSCLNRTRKEQKVLRWTKRITDLHEDLMPNDPLARAMDLHNNEVGRKLISKFKQESENMVIQNLKDMAKRSKQIGSLEDLKNLSRDQLTHIVEANSDEG